jgi:hypothetical protein
MLVTWIIFIAAVIIFALLFYVDKRIAYKKSEKLPEDDEMLFDAETGTKFSVDDVRDDSVVIDSDIDRIKTDEEIESNYHSGEIQIEKTKNYLRKKGLRSFKLEEHEDPEFLNELSVFHHYTQLYFDTCFQISERKVLVFVQVTYEITSGEGSGIYTETQLLFWYKSHNSNGHLSTSEELFIDELKSNKELSFLKRANNYFFKTNRFACIDDVDLLIAP